MEKANLRAAFESLSVGESVRITLSDGKEASYKFIEKKVGRGRSGTLFATFVSEETGDKLVLSTKTSEEVQNIVFGTFSFETAEEIPREEVLVKMRKVNEMMKPFLGKAGLRVFVKSTDENSTGEYTLVECRKLPGKFGQMFMALTGPKELKIRSYRHAMKIEDIALV